MHLNNCLRMELFSKHSYSTSNTTVEILLRLVLVNGVGDTASTLEAIYTEMNLRITA